MSLKAVHKSSYRTKTGSIMDVYTVTGPKTEIQDYIISEANRRGIDPDKITLNEQGLPLMYRNRTMLLRSGEMPKSSYTLAPNHDGSRWNIDSTSSDMADYAEMTAKKKDYMAEYAAKLALGLITPERNAAPVNNPALPSATPAAAPGAPSEEIDELDKLTSKIEAGNETLAE